MLKRPAAFNRGPSRKPMSSGKIGGCTPAICTSFLRPIRDVRAISIEPRCTRTRFSPRSGTMSATVPSATRSRLVFKSNPGIGRVFSSAWQSLKTIPTEHRYSIAQSPIFGFTIATQSGTSGFGSWWSSTITSTPRLLSSAISVTDAVPQSTAISNWG